MRRFDLWQLLAVVVLAVCATLVQRSTAQALAQPGFVTRQVAWLALGFGLMIVFALADYRILVRLAPLLYGAALVVLFALLFVAPLRAGTRAWLTLGSYTIQPSEFARVATLLAVAAVARRMQRDRLTFGGAASIAAAVVAPMALIAAEPDLGVALTYAPIVLAALWVGGLPWRAWLVLVVGGIGVAVLAFGVYLKPYQRERILTFVDPNRAPYGAGYQQRQSTIAVGSGGLAGRGARAGTQSQLRFLPAQQTDFIFAVWAEEAGFLGAAVVIGAYFVLVGRILVVAIVARDRAGAVLAACTGVVLATQVVVNLAMVTGLAPITGITLPFLSYGGSSVLATGMMLGLVQSVWRLRYANV
jgi:rod shape determining protein RodA